MLSQPLVWLLELLLLAALIHVFLRVVRQTRGKRLVRGFLVALLLGALGLFGLVEQLELEELGHLLENAAGYVLVVVAIMFQPELRRAISQLGSNPFVGGGGARVASSTLEQLASAARAMARRRHGALIAISGQSPLQTIVEKATSLDAPVSRSLVESIFQPGGVLHDGGIVISDDRVLAAQCIFPLSESPGLGAWSGTRHRAALGLSEESDAVVLAVSEETGRISLFQGGKRRGPIPPDELLDALRETVGGKVPAATRGRVPGGSPLPVRLGSEMGWIGLSLALAAGLLIVVHGQISVSQSRPLRLALAGQERSEPPSAGQLLLRLPTRDWTLAETDRSVAITMYGTRRRLERAESELAGEIEVSPERDGRLTLDVDEIRWLGAGPGLALDWTANADPKVQLRPVVERRFTLEAGDLPLDLSRVDPRFVWDRDSTRITPDQLLVKGPRELLEGLDAGAPVDLFEPVVVRADARGQTSLGLALRTDLAEQGLELPQVEQVEVRFDLIPAARDLGVVEREISIACLDSDRASELGRWRIELFARTARLRILTEGLIAEREDEIGATRAARLRAFVEDQLQVYVDVSELPEDGSSRSLPVRWTLRRDWRDSLEDLALEGVTLSGDERLELRIESDRQVLLSPSETSDDDASNGDQN